MTPDLAVGHRGEAGVDRGPLTVDEPLQRSGLIAESLSSHGQIRTMRKEIKRALLVWPLVASSTISSMTWFSTLDLAAMRSRAGSAAVELVTRANSMAKLVQPQIAPARRTVDGSLVALRQSWPVLKNPIAGRWKPSEPPATQPNTPDASDLHEFVVGGPTNVIARAPRLNTNRELAGLSMLRSETYGTSDSIQWDVVPLGPRTVTASTRREHKSVLPESIRVLGRYRPDHQSLGIDGTETDTDKPDGPPAPPTKPEPISLGQAPAAKQTPDAQPESAARDVAAANQHKGDTHPAGWPEAAALHEMLNDLAGIATAGDFPSAQDGAFADDPAARWAGQVDSRLRRLQSFDWLGDPDAGSTLQQLATFAEAGLQLAEQVDDRQLQIQWLRTAHGLNRRLAVWGAVWKVVDSGARQSIDGSRPVFSVLADSDAARKLATKIAGLADQVESELARSNDPGGWHEFLLLDDIRAAVDNGSPAARAEVAQRFLSRLQWYGLQPSQRQWLDRPAVNELADSLRTWSATPIDYAKLVRDLERQENNAIDLSAIDVADAVQSLRFSGREASVAVAKSITTHYRNANMRFAVTDQLMRRLLPPVQSQVQPVRTTLLGSRVRGTSQINSDLDLRLVPSRDRWSLELLTQGDVSTRAVGLNGPVALRTVGNSNFLASTPIQLTTDAVKIGSSSVSVNNQTRLRGIRSDYDGLPLIGSLVRSIAAGRYADSAPIANRITESRIRQSISGEIDQQVQEKVRKATGQFSDVVVGPLGRMDLEPMVVDMETTPSRLLARYRLAGDWQMAAFTPRPRAPHNSLMSLQLHQSAINNTLEQMVPRDEPASIRDMVDSAMSQFGVDTRPIIADLPDDVTIQFAPTRPITVEIEDDRLWLTLRIVQLKGEDGFELRTFIVRAKYRAEFDGNRAYLVRDSGLSIQGPRMSMRQRLPARAIFNKVLDDDRPLPLTMPQMAEHPAVQDLEVSQLILRDGWIGLAMGPADASASSDDEDVVASLDAPTNRR